MVNDIVFTETFTRGATGLVPFGPGPAWPGSYAGVRDEYLAGRTAAWLGVTLNNSPVYDVIGPDAVAFMNQVAVNRDFSHFVEGASRHVLLCNDEGYMLADGVAIKIGPDHFRTYWLAPVLDFFLTTSGLDVHGEWVMDEYFFQIDGPKSLEIMEEVSGEDLHDLKFARNRRITIAGTDATLHRLGMSGGLGYELHGSTRDAEQVYALLRTAVERHGGSPQGILNYATVNHTPAGYANQLLHFINPVRESGAELAAYISTALYFDGNIKGSAADDRTNYYATPYDVGWGFLVNFDHDFRGKAALQEIAKQPPHTMVTLEWNADDVADIHASQLRGTSVEPFDSIEYVGVQPDGPTTLPIRADYVLIGDEKIGVATGRTVDYFARRMISLATIDSAHAAEGTEVEVLWGDLDSPKKRVRAVVARFPYYTDARNETFDTSSIPRASR